MKLSLMKRFYATMDEDKTSPVLDLLASRWFDSFDARMLRASANFVAVVKANSKKYYLRFNHEEERSVSHVMNELSYIQRLWDVGVNANEPVPSLQCKLLESVKTELGVLNAVMFTEVVGEHRESSDLDLEDFSKWGAALASIHEASRGLQLERPPVWSDQLNQLESITDKPLLLNESEVVRKKLVGLTQENYGLIMFDFEMDNIKWSGDVLGFMDFDDFCIHWYAADIAYALRDLFDDKMSDFDPNDPRVKGFVDGYRSVRGISDDELDLIPVFIRLHNLYFYARLHRAIGLDESNEPEWVTNLRNKLRKVNDEYVEDIKTNPVL